MKFLNLVFPILLILGFSIFAWVSQSNDVDFNWAEEAVTITDPAKDMFTIRYADVTSMTLEDRPDWGHCLNGESRQSWVYGMWENDIWGTYRLLAKPDAGRCIVFRTAQIRYVLSYESDKTTAALYEQLLPMIEAAQKLTVSFAPPSSKIRPTFDR